MVNVQVKWFYFTLFISISVWKKNFFYNIWTIVIGNENAITNDVTYINYHKSHKRITQILLQTVEHFLSVLLNQIIQSKERINRKGKHDYWNEYWESQIALSAGARNNAIWVNPIFKYENKAKAAIKNQHCFWFPIKLLFINLLLNILAKLFFI